MKPRKEYRTMELIALAVLFALGFVPLFLATELASGHPDTERQAFRPPMNAGAGTQGSLAASSSGSGLPVAANDEHERQAA
jgi:hypothetical protein